MKKEDLFEAIGEVSSRTVQYNTSHGYRARVTTVYVRWAAAIAAVIVVGTSLYVFRIVGLTGRVKTGPAGEASMATAAMGDMEEAAPAADEAPVGMPVPAMEAAAESAEYEEAEAVTEMPQDEVIFSEAAEDAAQSESKEAGKDNGYNGMLQKEEDWDPLLASIDLPTSPNWITVSSQMIDESSIEVNYKDLIAEADCTFVGIRGKELALPGIDYGNAATIKREYTSSLTDGNKITAVTLKKSEDKKDVLITWEYDDYKFAIVAEFTGDSTDADPIMKTAYYIIDGYMGKHKPD